MTKHKNEKKHHHKDHEKNIDENISNSIESENEKEIIEENNQSNEESKLKDILTRTQADFANYKARVERDRNEMIVFLKMDIFKNLLPRIDDLERIISQTPENQRENGIYEWVLSVHKKIISDLEKMWVKSYDSIWSEIDPNFHEVMTQIPWEDWIILEEFEKWYMIWDKVLRVAKVVVWQS